MKANFDSLKLQVEGMSGGKNTVIFDDVDMPSIMVRIPKMKNSQLVSGSDEEYHDAFHVHSAIVDAIYMGKFLATVVNGRAYSLAGKDPTVSLNFDKAREYCRAKGKGWHLPTNAFYSAIALWTKQNKTMPHGNTQWGKDHACTWETGFPTTLETGSSHNGEPAHIATGSGPDSWYHDWNSATGIADLCGNVWEWASGLRLQDGEIQVIQYGDAMDDTLTGAQDIMKSDSANWKAISKDGAFVEPGSDNTLKWDYTGSPAANTGDFELTTEKIAHKQENDTAYGYSKFGAMKKHGELVIPKRAILLGLYPDGETPKDTDYDSRGGFWFRNNGERLPIRGGHWIHGANAGVFALDLDSPRTIASANIGFRVAYYGDM